MDTRIHCLVALVAAVFLFVAVAPCAHAVGTTMDEQQGMSAQQPTGPPPGQHTNQQQAQRPQSGPQGSGLRGFLPLILVVGLYLLLRRTFRNMGNSLDDRNDRTRDDFPGDRGPDADPEHMKDAYDNARRTWEAFTARPGEDTPAGAPQPVLDEKAEQERDFLEGARLAFATITEAMDRLEVDTVAQLAGSEVVNRVKLRLNAEDEPVESEVSRVGARVVDHPEKEGREVILVRFDAEKKSPDGVGSIHEIWRFERDANDPDSHWTLMSIEAAED